MFQNLELLLNALEIYRVQTEVDIIISFENVIHQKPSTGSMVVMHSDSCVDFGAIWIVCVFT